ncbi:MULTISPECIES: ArsR/SmtB family transcription factor [unclassified Fictibacillus]|uniref:ArsR/SmtB family transcription factor n=1 Tax=unclassified Fictibacillus TaxID=2644029 RepID=UPI000780D614|nr:MULTISPECIES: helix-turn-helix domain-containing protein [unclassified Fictibacillus]UZJ78125.1 helix-turn-helix domain-containing protein [Fictibacillus sp. KU28468]
MQEIYYLEDAEQLKVISDPLRLKVLWEIIDEAKTGKMIADILEAPAPKIHYHLKELDRVGLITVEKTEEKNGIIQKFYRPIARNFSVENILKQHKDHVKNELSDTLRENVLISLDKTKSYLRRVDSSLFEEWKQIKFGYDQLYLNEAQIQEFEKKAKELQELINSFKKTRQQGGELYHMLLLAFPFREPEYPDE